MIQIRPEQKAALDEAAQQEFERRAVAIIRRCWNDQHAEWGGDAGTLEVVRAGVEQAAAYGLRYESEVLHFLNLICYLGMGFDKRIEWAAAILAGSDPPAVKVQRLSARARFRP